MTTTEQPSWGVSDVNNDPPLPNQPGPGLGRRAIGGAVISAAAVFGGVMLLTTGDSQPVDGEVPALETTEDSQALVTEAVVSPTVATNPPTTVPPTTALPTTGAPATTVPTTVAPTTAATTVDPASAAGTVPEAQSGSATEVALAADQRGAVFRGGIMYLSGPVASQAVSDELTRRVGAIVGPANVVTNHTIDPSVEASDTSFLFIDDLVLFDPGQSEVTEAFEALLDLGTVLMNLNPAIEITVEAHTDSIGPASENLALSQLRADAVKEYWVAAGIDPNRITALGRGESDPYADNKTSDGRQLNRRAEFTILNFLG